MAASGKNGAGQPAVPLGQAAILSVREAAYFLGMTEKALRRHIERGRVPHRRLGRKLVFLTSEIEKWVRELPGVTLEDVKAMQEIRR